MTNLRRIQSESGSLIEILLLLFKIGVAIGSYIYIPLHPDLAASVLKWGIVVCILTIFAGWFASLKLRRSQRRAIYHWLCLIAAIFTYVLAGLVVQLADYYQPESVLANTLLDAFVIGTYSVAYGLLAFSFGLQLFQLVMGTSLPEKRTTSEQERRMPDSVPPDRDPEPQELAETTSAYRIALVPNRTVEPFLLPLPDLLNSVQSTFRFSIATASDHEDVELRESADVDQALIDLYSLKTNLDLSDEDLLIRFISEPLESRPRGLGNLFIASSSLFEEPPRVAVVSTSFIHKHILPIDPAYLAQRHAFYHLIVCCIAGAFLELPAHEDRGCLMDFNNNPQNIQRKISAGYTFCNSCTALVKQHHLGDSLLKICAALKTSASESSTISKSEKQSTVFLCYSGPDREKVFELYKQLANDGFKPWMDKEDLIGGQNWKLAIQRAIESADYFIACLSSNFQHRTYGHREIKLALEVLDTIPEGAIYLIPVRLEDCEIEHRLADRQWVDLFETDGYARLVKALRWNQTPDTHRVALN